MRAFATITSIALAAATIGGTRVGASAALQHRPTVARACTPQRAEIAVPGHAMSVLSSRHGCTLYVTVSANGPGLAGAARPRNGVAVLRMKDGAFTPTSFLPLQDEPAQMALSPDERRLYVADNRAGIAEFDAGASGTLRLQRYLLSQLRGGFFQIALSPRGDVLYGGAMKIDRVVSIPLDAPQRFKSAPADHFPVGLALSQDGRLLYVTNAVAVDPAHPKFHPVKCSYRSDLRRLAVVPDEGTLQVFDAAALSQGSKAQLARVRAGCAPVRVALDEQRHIIWMTARESDVLIGYPQAGVLHGATTAPLLVRTGKSPVGLAIGAADGILAVGDSARFEKRQRRQMVALYSTHDLLLRAPHAMKVEEVGAFPRDIVINAAGTAMYVANFGSSSVSVIPMKADRRQ